MQINIYFLADKDFNGRPFISYCGARSRGRVLDNLHNTCDRHWLVRDEFISEQVLTLRVDQLEAIDKYPESFKTVFIYRSLAAGFDDPWYLNPEEAMQAYKVENEDGLDKRALDCTPTVYTQFPMKVEFVEGRKGPQCNVNLHPERDSIYALGPYCFPARDFVNPTVGPAVINGVEHELPSYSFLHGHMISFADESPTYEEILDYLFKTRSVTSPNNIYLQRIDSKSFGTFYMLLYNEYRADGTRKVSRLVKEGDKVTESMEFPQTLQNCLKEADITIRVTGTEALLDEHLGGSDVCFSGRFHEAEYFNRHFNVKWVDAKNDNNLPDILNDGCSQGILRIYRLEGYNIFYVLLNKGKLYELCAYDLDEIEDMINASNKTNDKGTSTIQQYMKKGRLKLIDV